MITARRLLPAAARFSENCTKFVGHKGEVLDVALSADGRFAFSAGCDRTIRQWEIHDGACVRIFAGHRDAVTAVCTDAEGESLFSAGADGTIRRWRIATGECRVFPSPPWGASPITSLAMVAHAPFVVSCGMDERTQVWDADSGRHMRTISHGGAWGQRFAGWLAGGASDVELQRAARAGYRCPMAISRDGRMILLANHRLQCLQTFELPTGRRLWSIPHTENCTRAVAFSADGRLAFSAGADRSIRVWTISDGKFVRMLTGHTAEITSLAVSYNGRLVLSGSRDKTVRLWEFASGRCLSVFSGHQDWVNAVQIAPSGTVALSAGAEGTLRRWRFD